MTIGGGLNIHTVAELEDLLAAKDVELPALEKNWRDFDKTWIKVDKAADDAWVRDYNSLKSRYGLAHMEAQATIMAASILPDAVKALAPAEEQYKLVLRALQQQSGVTAPGDLQGLWNRLDAARQSYFKANGLPPTPMVEPPVPQPRASSDADERILKATAWMDPSTKSGKGTFGWLIAGIGAAILGVAFVKAKPSVVVVSEPGAHRRARA